MEEISDRTTGHGHKRACADTAHEPAHKHSADVPCYSAWDRPDYKPSPRNEIYRPSTPEFRQGRHYHRPCSETEYVKGKTENDHLLGYMEFCL